MENDLTTFRLDEKDNLNDKSDNDDPLNTTSVEESKQEDDLENELPISDDSDW